MSTNSPANLDALTIRGFGEEWSAYDQTGMPPQEVEAIFDAYFSCFRWDLIDESSSGFDMGCGSGRWAKLLAPRIGHLHCIDPSAAIEVARRNLEGLANISFHQAVVEKVKLEPASMDFGVSLGVLHHVPDTAAAIKSCVALLKPGAPLLLYLYYRFDNKPAWYRLLWQASDGVRHVVARMPRALRLLATSLIAIFIYWPLARMAWLLSRLRISVRSFPLSFYQDASFYTMRTDALDRFGTRLEQRFTRQEITTMLEAAGCVDVRFSNTAPYWCVCAIRHP